MNSDNRDVFVYLLIDNGLLQEASAGYTEEDANSRPDWLEPIYTKRALEVSPFLVNIESAYKAGAIDQVMGYLNARRPALHVSIIETELDLGQIAQHLRRFVFILDPEDKQFTLRYADCVVLAVLSSLLTTAQWMTMRGKIIRWGVHDRAGAIIQLPSAQSSEQVPVPLRLEREQLVALDEASEPDHVIGKVQMMRHGADLPGNAVEHHAWAQAAYQIWQGANNTNQLFLIFLTEATLLTKGNVLYRKEIQDFLVQDQVSVFRENLQKIVNEINHRGSQNSKANAVVD